MATLTVTFFPSGNQAKVVKGTSVLDAARAAGVLLETPCGGEGRCGKCLVRGGVGLDAPATTEKELLGAAKLESGWRLACQARVIGDARITVPPTTLSHEHRIMIEGLDREIAIEPHVRKVALELPSPAGDDPRADLRRVIDALGDVLPSGRLQSLRNLPGILRDSGFHITAVVSGNRLIAVENGDTMDSIYGLAVDIGTTTIVAYLCHLPTGRVLATASDLNSQTQYGDDVISRIRAATSSRDDLADMAQVVKVVINDLIERVCHNADVTPNAIYDIAIVGNTCMTHLLLGVSPEGLGTIPFVPSFRGPQTVSARALGIGVHPDARVYIAPSIGGFVGADTLGLILSTEIDLMDGTNVAVDIGTNGEIVVARNGELLASSTAAGPAFEGARIRHGMRAATGAIDEVSIADDVQCHVIGEGYARGVCGSGLVDAIAELVRVGIIDESGRMAHPGEAKGVPEQVESRVIENQNGVEFVLVPEEISFGGEAVTLTAQDVRETQMAKAAIYGGMNLMLEHIGATSDEVRELLLAGAFGNYIRQESAVAIGLIPSLPNSRIRPVGNAAGVGAKMILLSDSQRRRAENIALQVRHIDLSETEDFYERFADAMALRPLPREH